MSVPHLTQKGAGKVLAARRAECPSRTPAPHLHRWGCGGCGTGEKVVPHLEEKGADHLGYGKEMPRAPGGVAAV
jgi:ribosomal protein S27AE